MHSNLSFHLVVTRLFLSDVFWRGARKGKSTRPIAQQLELLVGGKCWGWRGGQRLALNCPVAKCFQSPLAKMFPVPMQCSNKSLLTNSLLRMCFWGTQSFCRSVAQSSPTLWDPMIANEYSNECSGLISFRND